MTSYLTKTVVSLVIFSLMAVIAAYTGGHGVFPLTLLFILWVMLVL